MIRSETEGDIDAIRKVLTAAFPGPEEARLVDDLRAAGDLSEQGSRARGEVSYAPAFAALG